MSQLTKKAIVETTVALAQARSLSKITVRDIVEACGITRNTFYYHFHDIYEVLECAIESEFESLKTARGDDLEKAILSFFDFCITHKRVWVNLYRSLGHERLYSYIFKHVHGLFVSYMQEVSEEYDLDPRDRDMITAFCEETILGMFLRWLRDEREDPGAEELRASVSRIRKFFSEQLHTALHACRRMPLSNF